MVTEKDSEDKLAKVRFNCRRGMLELDVMLQHFFESSYRELSSEKQQLFEELLNAEDQDLHRWLIGTEACTEPRFQDMLLVIRHMYARHAKQEQPA